MISYTETHPEKENASRWKPRFHALWPLPAPSRFSSFFAFMLRLGLRVRLIFRGAGFFASSQKYVGLRGVHIACFSFSSKFHGRIDFSSISITKCFAEVAIIKASFHFRIQHAHRDNYYRSLPFSLLQNYGVNAASTCVYALNFPIFSFYLSNKILNLPHRKRGKRKTQPWPKKSKTWAICRQIKVLTNREVGQWETQRRCSSLKLYRGKNVLQRSSNCVNIIIIKYIN